MLLTALTTTLLLLVPHLCGGEGEEGGGAGGHGQSHRGGGGGHQGHQGNGQGWGSDMTVIAYSLKAFKVINDIFLESIIVHFHGTVYQAAWQCSWCRGRGENVATLHHRLYLYSHGGLGLTHTLLTLNSIM